MPPNGASSGDRRVVGVRRHVRPGRLPCGPLLPQLAAARHSGRVASNADSELDSLDMSRTENPARTSR